MPGRLASRFGRTKNVTIAAEKVITGFAQPGELVVPILQVFGRKLILVPNEIPNETCQTLAVGDIVPLEIEDWEDGRAIELEPCTDQTIRQRPGQIGMGIVRDRGAYVGTSS